VCFLGNVKALKINDNLKEWNVKLDCQISHHYLGFFLDESFFVQFIDSICIFHK